jgi:hypothetical protein
MIINLYGINIIKKIISIGKIKKNMNIYYGNIV